MLQCKCLLSNCEVKHDIHVEMENSGIWLVQAEKIWIPVFKFDEFCWQKFHKHRRMKFDWNQLNHLNFSLPVTLEVYSQYILQVVAQEVSKFPLIDLIPLDSDHSPLLKSTHHIGSQFSKHSLINSALKGWVENVGDLTWIRPLILVEGNLSHWKSICKTHKYIPQVVAREGSNSCWINLIWLNSDSSLMTLLLKSSRTKISLQRRTKWPLIGPLQIMWRLYLCSASWHSWTEMSSRWTGIGSSLPFVFRTSKKIVWSTTTTQAGKSHNWGNERKTFWYKRNQRNWTSYLNIYWPLKLWSVSVSHIKDKTQVAKVAIFQREKVATN